MNEYDFIAHTDLDTALAWHLQYNHYPAVPAMMLPVCAAAIDLAVMGEWDELVALPEPVSYRGMAEAPVHAIIEQHHLHAFVESAFAC